MYKFLSLSLSLSLSNVCISITLSIPIERMGNTVYERERNQILNK